MSTNQYSTDYYHDQTLIWQQPGMNNNIPHAWFRFQNDAVQQQQQQHREDPPSETEALFEKHLTPSDVGKLNRLVIPKQHAERCFPLAGETPPPSSSSLPAAEKGVLLCFEDVEDGREWRFRYSYWNSSQSYVLTKGWSRYVKEKRLDAGDVVFFLRHRADGRRLFIGWRRRRGGGSVPAASRPPPPVAYGTTSFSDHSEYVHPGQVGENQTIQMTGNLRTVRLFGVNLECQPDDDRSEPSTPDQSSETGDGHQHYVYSQLPYHPSYHTDMTFQPRDH